MTQTDEQLMLSVKEGDRDAFQILTERHYSNTLNFIYRFVKNRPLAEDLCQETFLRLWRCVPTYRPIAKFRTFLYHIAKNVCLKHLAKEQRTPHIESLDTPASEDDENCRPIAVAIADTHYSPEAVLIAQETHEAIQSAINKLSKEHQLVFQLTETSGVVLPRSRRYRPMSDWHSCLTQKRCDSTTPEIFGTLQDELIMSNTTLI